LTDLIDWPAGGWRGKEEVLERGEGGGEGWRGSLLAGRRVVVVGSIE
jgi:hypothetical protein